MSNTSIKPLYCFLWLPDFSDFFEADYNDSFNIFVQNIKESTTWAIREKATQVFRSQQQQDNLAAERKDDPLLYDRILLFLDSIDENITIIPTKNTDNCYYEWQDGNLKQINSTGLEDFAEIFLQENYTKENSLLILFADLPINTCNALQEYCCVIKDKKPHEPNRFKLPVFIKMALIDGTTPNARNWLLANRTPRIFNDSSDVLKRHKISKNAGKTGEKNHFIYEQTTADKERIQKLLNTAISPVSSIDKAILFNWDAEADNGRYIVFEDEATLENTYHAYHLIATDFKGLQREKLSLTKEIQDLLRK